MAAHTETYYVGLDGREDNDGSREKPWPSVEYALGKVGGGNTIIVKPGVYHGPIVIEASAAGTKGQPTVIKSEIKWKATIVGSETHCTWTASAITPDGVSIFTERSADRSSLKSWSTARLIGLG